MSCFKFKPTSQQFALLGFAAFLIATTIHVSTITISPTVWSDEVQQVDFGRLIYEPDSEWSVKWSPVISSPVKAWSYIGPVIHESAFRIFSNDS